MSIKQFGLLAKKFYASAREFNPSVREFDLSVKQYGLSIISQNAELEILIDRKSKIDYIANKHSNYLKLWINRNDYYGFNLFL